MDILKGTKDSLPEQKILKNKIINILQKTFEKYGFNPLDTPAIELYETLASKYAGGEEILKETYKLSDQGKRELALRYDLTVPFARVIGMNPTLKMPFKRYQIDKVWRDGPIKPGRLREFTQCDVDVAGAKSLLADAEMLAMAQDIFKQLNLPVTITVNNRKILDAYCQAANIPPEKASSVILTLDKLKKIGVQGVTKELTEKNIEQEQINTIIKLISVSGTNEEKLAQLKNLLQTDGLAEIEQVLNFATDMNVTITFDPTLARGLSYYTATIYEVYATDSPITSSLAAGGRYDGMIGKLAQRKEEVPAVGISFGLDVICEVLKTQEQKTLVQVYVIPIKTNVASFVAQLREANINTDCDLNNKGISKNLDYANAYNIPYVVIVGENEIAENKFTLKNMKEGTEEKLTLQEIITKISQ